MSRHHTILGHSLTVPIRHSLRSATSYPGTPAVHLRADCFSEGQCCRVISAYFATRYWTASALSRRPCLVENNAVLSHLAGSFNHSWTALETVRVRGVPRSFRPLPRQ